VDLPNFIGAGREYMMTPKTIASTVISIIVVVGIIVSLLPAGGLVMD